MASSRPVAAPPARQKAMEDARLKAEYEAARANGAPNDTEENQKALYEAAKKGNTDAVRGYIAKGVNVNWKNPNAPFVRAPPIARVPL